MFSSVAIQVSAKSKEVASWAPASVRARILEVQSVQGSNRNSAHSQIEASNDIEAVSEWLRAVASGSEATRKRYKGEALRFITWLSIDRAVPLSGVRAADLHAYKAFLLSPEPASLWCSPAKDGGLALIKGPMSDRSVGHSLSILSGLFRYLADSAYLIGNPFPAFGRVRFMAKDQLGRTHVSNKSIVNEREVREIWLKGIWQAINDQDVEMPDEKRIRLRFVFMLLAFSGIRRSEAAYLPMNAFFHTEEGWFLSVLGKGRKSRNVPVPKPLIEELKRYRTHLGLTALPSQSDDSPAIRPTRGEMRFMTDGQLYRIVKQLSQMGSDWLAKTGMPEEAIGLADFTPHLFRRRYVTKLLRDGGDIIEVQAIVGHESVNTTRIYATESSKRAAEMVSKSYDSTGFDI